MLRVVYIKQGPLFTWWRHQMGTFSALLAICAGNSPVTGEFPTQTPVTRSFDVFFDLRLNKRLSTQSWGWWFETPSLPLWSHCNVTWINFETSNIKCGMILLIHTKTSTVQPLKFGNGYWFHPTLQNKCSYLFMLGLTLIHVSKTDASYFRKTDLMGFQCYDYKSIVWTIDSVVK